MITSKEVQELVQKFTDKQKEFDDKIIKKNLEYCTETIQREAGRGQSKIYIYLLDISSTTKPIVCDNLRKQGFEIDEEPNIPTMAASFSAIKISW